jgi:hypothetical protein
MTRDTLLLILAPLIAVAPFAGIPLSWLNWLLPLIGLAVLIIGISFRRDRTRPPTPPQTLPPTL